MHTTVSQVDVAAVTELALHNAPLQANAIFFHCSSGWLARVPFIGAEVVSMILHTSWKT